MRGKGTFAPSVVKLEKALDFLGGEHMMISSVLNRLLPKIEKIVKFVRSYPVTALYMGLFEPLPNNAIHHRSPSAVEMTPAVLYLLNTLTGEIDPQLLFSESYDLIKTSSPFTVRCRKKIIGSTIKVQADGWAYPGPFFYQSFFRLGRPKGQGWAALQNSRVFVQLSELAGNRINSARDCKQCFWSCRCAGGSQALTWAAYGKWNVTCPLCELYKATLDSCKDVSKP